jgi:hypothetical protein
MRLRVLSVPLALLVLAGPVACGDDSSSGKDASDTRATPTTAPKPTGRRLHHPEEYKGVYAQARELCSSSTRKKVAAIAGSHSARREDIARAVANGYKPRLRKKAYRGCLAGLE